MENVHINTYRVIPYKCYLSPSYITTFLWYCCCCCCIASVVSDSVRAHRRQPTRFPSPGFSRQEHWSGCHFLLNAGKWKGKLKSLSCVRLFATPWTVAYQAPPPMGVSRQEDWSGVPFPFPFMVLANEKWIIFLCVLSCFSCVWLFPTLWTVTY